MKPGKQFTALEKEADELEPRVERAMLRALERIRARVDVNGIANMISAKQGRAAMRLLPTADEMAEIFEAVGRLQAEAYKRGVKLGIEELERL